MQAAALAEFRADWATAVKTYQNSYAEIARVPLGPPLPLQRAWEVAAVAEQVHVKVDTIDVQMVLSTWEAFFPTEIVH